LAWLIRARLGGIDGRRVTNALIRIGLASAVMGVALWGLTQLHIGSEFVVTATGIVAGGVVYGGTAWLLRAEELRGIFTLLRKRTP
jgi:hypothetical protein